MPDNLPKFKKHLFLTGEKRVGKSTLLQELIRMKGMDCAGFETRHIEINGLRRAHILHGLIDMPPYENDCICCVRINERMSVPVLPVFEQNGTVILQKSMDSSSPYLLMDELGKLEREAEHFINQIMECLDSDKRVLGVLQMCHAPHIEAIKSRNDVTILQVTEENRDDLLDMLIKFF